MTSDIPSPIQQIHSGTASSLQPANQLDIERGVGMMGSATSLRKILQTVTMSLGSNIKEIGTLLDAGDVPSANRLLHAIKGYAPIFCADDLVAQVTHVEGVSKTASVTVVAPLFDALRPQLEHLVNEIDKYLAED